MATSTSKEIGKSSEDLFLECSYYIELGFVYSVIFYFVPW